jgi:hypothetical protein
MWTAMHSYAYWTPAKTNHKNAPAYVSVIGTLCAAHVWANSCTCQYITFFPGKGFNEYPMHWNVWKAILCSAFLTCLQSQPEKNLSTWMKICSRNSLLSVYFSPGVTHHAAPKQARYYQEVIHVLRCDAMYSGRKVPRHLCTFSYSFRVANPSILKTAAVDPSEMLPCFVTRIHTRTSQRTVLHSAMRAYTHTSCSWTRHSISCNLWALQHTSSWHGTQGTFIVPFVVAPNLVTERLTFVSQTNIGTEIAGPKAFWC